MCPVIEILARTYIWSCYTPQYKYYKIWNYIHIHTYCTYITHFSGVLIFFTFQQLPSSSLTFIIEWSRSREKKARNRFSSLVFYKAEFYTICYSLFGRNIWKLTCNHKDFGKQMSGKLSILFIMGTHQTSQHSHTIK